MPPPQRSIRHDTCCSPVPDAATIPILPFLTLFAKPRGTPFTIAVPQSGPIMRSPPVSAFFLRKISSSSGILSLNSITSRPKFKAFKASAVAYSPGQEMRAKLASGDASRAISILLGGSFLISPAIISEVVSLSLDSAITAASCRAISLSPASAKRRSLLPASGTVSISPASRNSSRLVAVAMMRDA